MTITFKNGVFTLRAGKKSAKFADGVEGGLGDVSRAWAAAHGVASRGPMGWANLLWAARKGKVTV